MHYMYLYNQMSHTFMYVLHLKCNYGDQYWYRDGIHIMVYWWLKNVKNVAPNLHISFPT